MPLRSLSLDELVIDDETSFAHVTLYARLKQALRKSGHRFRVPETGEQASWDRVLFLNLTFWSAEEAADVLCDEHIPADVVCHIAWHRLASDRMAAAVGSGAMSALALLFGESIASAFDLYLVGRLLDHAPESDFITTQVPILSDVAAAAGLSEAAFASLLTDVSRQPERAFEDLRALLFSVAAALLPCTSAEQGQQVLESFRGHRFAPLLHHFQLSNWILYARAYAATEPALDQTVRRFDQTLREAPVALDWLAAEWLKPPL